MNERLFPPNHQTRLLTTFKHVDEVLVQALSRLESASESPFSEYVADAGHAECKVLAEYLDQLRAVMRGFLDRHQISVPQASTAPCGPRRPLAITLVSRSKELQARYLRALWPSLAGGCRRIGPDRGRSRRRAQEDERVSCPDQELDGGAEPASDPSR